MNQERIQLLAKSHPDIPANFTDWLAENFPIWERFEQEALTIARSGREHYSAYTIREYIRHETLLREKGTDFKLTNNVTPSLARLFALANPEFAGLFTFKAIRRAA
ncbi:MAG: hypothetical protein RL661_884 [Pseudomonadota bacterium]|jgi:hypothetical protein